MLSLSSKNKTPVIGIMTGSFHTDYSRMLADAICESLKNEDVAIRLFQGFDANRYLAYNPNMDGSFDKHYYSTFEYGKFVNLDLLIVSYGTISAVPNPIKLSGFLKPFKDVPVIIIEDDTELKNGIYVTVDNYSGMRLMVEYIIKDCGCKKPVFVSGPKYVPDAKKRLNAYIDVMTENNIPIENDMIIYGDFSDQVDGLIKEHFPKVEGADAVICANDEMAQSAYRVLSEMGLKIGTEIKVTGFDDSDVAQFMVPPLTTVRQDFTEVARLTSEKIRTVIHGGTATSESVPAKLVIRESTDENYVKDDADEKSSGHNKQGKIFEEQTKIKALQTENLLSSLMLRGLITPDVTVESFAKKLGTMLHSFGRQRSCVCLLEKPLIVDGRKRMFLPNTLRMVMLQKNEKVQAYSIEDAPIIDCNNFSDHMERHGIKHSQMASFPLFQGDRHYGVLFVELPRAKMLFYYTLSLELGFGISSLYLTIEQRKIYKALEEKNRLLDFSASHDVLTGLYNRAGVMSHAFTFADDRSSDTQLMVVMADLDHLKQINDTFGHDAGDSAIKCAADILTQCAPEESIIGRTGGDEFLMFAVLPDKNEKNAFIKRVKDKCEDYNETAQKPYYIGISLGCYEYKGGGKNFMQMIKKADTLMYEAKKTRRQNVIK